MSAPTSITLEHPFEFQGTRYDTLQFPPELLAKHLYGVDLKRLQFGDQMTRLISNIVGIPEVAAQQLRIADMLKASAVVNAFFGQKSAGSDG